MNELTIKHGQFYRGNEIVKPVCGDTEQIECLKKFDKAREKASCDGIEVEMDVDISYELHFKCVCGRQLKFEGSDYGVRIYDCIEDLVIDDIRLLDKKTKCSNCGTKYYSKVDNEGNIVAVLKE